MDCLRLATHLKPKKHFNHIEGFPVARRHLNLNILFAPSANMDTTISNPLITCFHLNNIDTTFRNLAVVSFTAWRRGGASLTRHPPVVITNSQDEIFLDEPFSFPRPWNQNYDRFLMASTQELSSMIR